LQLSDTVVPLPEPSSHINPSACPAARLPEADRINLAVLALAGTATITDLAAGHNVSRKFVYQQANKASLPWPKFFLRAHRMTKCCSRCLAWSAEQHTVAIDLWFSPVALTNCAQSVHIKRSISLHKNKPLF